MIFLTYAISFKAVRTRLSFFKVAINTIFNLHIFSMKGWLPHPYPVTVTDYPIHGEVSMITLFVIKCPQMTGLPTVGV